MMVTFWYVFGENVLCFWNDPYIFKKEYYKFLQKYKVFFYEIIGKIWKNSQFWKNLLKISEEILSCEEFL